MSRASSIVSVVCPLLAVVLGCAAQPEQKQEEQLAGASKNWKVVVVSAQCRLPGEESPWGPPGERIGSVKENRCLLFLHLRFEYKGPNSDVSAPRVTLMNEEGEKFNNYGNLQFEGEDPIGSRMDVLQWLMSGTYPEGQRKSLPLKTGETFGTPSVGFLLEVPRDFKGLKLIFGGEEIPGIVIKATKAK